MTATQILAEAKDHYTAIVECFLSEAKIDTDWRPNAEATVDDYVELMTEMSEDAGRVFYVSEDVKSVLIALLDAYIDGAMSH